MECKQFAGSVPAMVSNIRGWSFGHYAENNMLKKLLEDEAEMNLERVKIVNLALDANAE
ncbi:hypothetical protein BWQ96_09724 [Gracilariopsis chorda]|uniref:Uncharacterized protein n=1 Tax=Gracilariopsis chorda TaxID=448386 RepID=A0A2V3IEQ6_9FLOR|nr:hypothetical protein BWQ96_09724 [Gracilariopsis chorda]|eukprot:PXF40569.1 hypothetical protein BWQ96_09724 [Gracilariopsis chorda]